MVGQDFRLSGFRSISWHESDTLKPVLLVRGRQQIRAVAARFFQRFFQSPAPNMFVVAAKQNFGDFPAAEFRRAGVVRKIEYAVICNSRFVIRGR